MKKKLLSLLGIVIFFVLLISSYKLNNLSGYKVSEWYDEYGNKLYTPIIKETKGEEYILISYFPKTENQYIVFPEISANYAELYLNDVLIKKFGFNKNNLFNIYLKPHLILLNNLKDQNKLKLVIYDLYKGGIRITPVLIPESKLHEYLLLYFINYGLISSIGGIILFLIILIISYIFFLDRKSVNHLYNYLFSMFFLFIATIDFHYYSFGNMYTFLLLKKIFYISMLLAFLFFLNTVTLKQNKYKIINIIIKISIIIPIFFYLIAKDYYQLMNYYNLFSWIPTALLLYIIILYNKNVKYTFLLTFLAATIIHDLILVNFSINNSKFLFSYGIFSYTILVGISLVEEIRKAHIKMRKISLKALKDPLTNAYNRLFLKQIHFNENDSLIFFDLNDLKKINNKHGHKKGDEVLIYTVETVRKHLRKEDYIIRLGGDEFLVILKNCDIKIAKEKFSKIQEDLKNYNIPVFISYGIVQYKDSLDKTIKRADKYMYKMKSEIKKSKKYKFKK
ncbi:hypothetical protein XO12_10820 [Marinitoga sp. 1154]|uniref:GGDEF domain-containing protein n=1 Tax=Marinitoga sp. 1154 TaxID=1643335 RepID=UPI001585E392|nr:GGDEF domain-containing protein [Marinitoga sp. 1154]NUV00549.1 hypothetical protein [Marinitoga sp. 1154]